MTITSAASGKLSRLRAWLRSDLRTLRWVFLALYLLLITGLFGVMLFQGADGMFLLVCGIVFVVAEALFVFGSGTIDLCRPLRRRRLLLPVVSASFMLAMLLAGLLMAALELADPHLGSSDWAGVAFWLVLPGSWIGWGVLLFVYAKQWQRYQVLSRFSRFLFAGSLLELVATVPAHVIVTRRPGCLVGLMTMLGISAGLCVMLFAFGPMIVVLFLRPRYRGELAKGTQFCATCGYDLRASRDRCPECGTGFSPPVSRAPLDPQAV